MRIAIGAMLCEGNSLTPVLTRLEDFDYAVDEDMYEKIAVADMLEKNGCEIVPTIYAHALPGGPMKHDDFLNLTSELVGRLPSAMALTVVMEFLSVIMNYPKNVC